MPPPIPIAYSYYVCGGYIHMKLPLRRPVPAGWFLSFLSCLLILLLASCADNTTATPEEQPRVNGFGTAANHPHALLAFPNHVIVLATHYGLFRSQDDGASWTEVAGGANQLMEGLMTYSLTSSPPDNQRIYVATQLATKDHKGTLGLYTSGDQGRTWKLSASEESLGTIYLAQAGNENPDQVFVYLNALGPLGLKMSMDNGQHFSSTGALPFGDVAALLALPDMPGQLLASSSNGLARSQDGGIHWELMKGIKGGIFGLTTAGPHSPIYAWGDAGVYRSSDGGKTFTLVYTQSALNSLTVSPTQPQTLYGKTGTAIYRSTDGGQSWTRLPSIKGNLYNVVADPNDPAQVYLSLSYPTEVHRFRPSGWTSLTPKP
ncbi:MAG: hypothetical protein E6J34_04195 [Chloroflexi bacterium]|nr:MAG: hypothetical protein E6J34_04195 [Chloroflexota bacterium]